MEIINQGFTIIDDINSYSNIEKLERIGRVCYKSEDKIKEGSAVKFISMIIARGHEAMLEHINITVEFITDRGVSHELVRHRVASFAQESTRYCNYNKKGITVIRPVFFPTNSAEFNVWEKSMRHSEEDYNSLIRLGRSPQEARTVLPNSLKTSIIITANIREWRHILKLRTAPVAHPQMIDLMIPLLLKFKEDIPILFNDIGI